MKWDIDYTNDRAFTALICIMSITFFLQPPALTAWHDPAQGQQGPPQRWEQDIINVCACVCVNLGAESAADNAEHKRETCGCGVCVIAVGKIAGWEVGGGRSGGGCHHCSVCSVERERGHR